MVKAWLAVRVAARTALGLANPETMAPVARRKCSPQASKPLGRAGKPWKPQMPPAGSRQPLCAQLSDSMGDVGLHGHQVSPCLFGSHCPCCDRCGGRRLARSRSSTAGVKAFPALPPSSWGYIGERQEHKSRNVSCKPVASAAWQAAAARGGASHPHSHPRWPAAQQRHPRGPRLCSAAHVARCPYAALLCARHSASEMGRSGRSPPQTLAISEVQEAGQRAGRGVPISQGAAAAAAQATCHIQLQP